jgi:flagellar biosynthesis/type III secretory pathway protein FliH
MTVLQLMSNGAWPIRADDPVLSPEDLLAVQHASTLAEQCEQHSAALVQAARAQVQQQIDAGFRQGMAEAGARCAARLLDYEGAHEAAWQQREKDVMALVMMIVERLAPALAQGELIRALVRQAVVETRQARRLLIKVHPDHVAAVEADLASLRLACAWLETLEVIGVAELAGDDCVLESPNGLINAGWATQLAAIRQVLDGAATPT